MRKLELIKIITKELKKNKNSQISQKIVRDVINQFCDTVGDLVADGEEIVLLNFGKFTSGYRKGRECYLPGTTELVTVEDKIFPKFIPGEEFRDKVNYLKKQ